MNAINNKASYAIIYTLTLGFLLLPVRSFSKSVYNIEKDVETSSIYISSQYKPSISHFRNFSIQASNVKKDVLESQEITESSTNNTLRSDSSATQFQDNINSFSLAVGYLSKGLRLEMEGSYEKFYIKNSNDLLKVNSNKYYSQVYTKNPQNSVIAGNNKLSLTSIMVNTCYDISINNPSLTPYLCTGIGVDFIKLFKLTYFKFAYQGKVGISYLINKRLLLFSDIYYHKVMGSKFKNLYIQQYTSDFNIHQNITPTLANLNIGYFGSEIGIRFIFN